MAMHGAAGTGECALLDEADAGGGAAGAALALREQVEQGESELATLREVLRQSQETCVRAQAETLEAEAQAQVAAKEAQESVQAASEIKHLQRELAAANAQLAQKQRSRLELQRHGTPSAQQLQQRLRRRNEEINQLTMEREGLMLNLRQVMEDRAALQARAELLAGERRVLRTDEARGRLPEPVRAVAAPAGREAEELRLAASELARERDAAVAARRDAVGEVAEVRKAEVQVLAELEEGLAARALQLEEANESMEARVEEQRRSAEEAGLAAKAALLELDELQKVKVHADKRAQVLEKQAANCQRAERKAKDQAERWRKEWAVANEHVQAVEKECETLSGERLAMYRFSMMLVVLALALVLLVIKAAAVGPEFAR